MIRHLLFRLLRLDELRDLMPSMFDGALAAEIVRELCAEEMAARQS